MEGGYWALLAYEIITPDKVVISLVHELLHNVGVPDHGEVKGTPEWDRFVQWETACSGSSTLLGYP